jgi:predicted membrane protein (TIGR00267 family)
MTGRGEPLIRGLITGVMTTLGGLGHTIPYLLPDFRVATIVAIVVVLIELWAIAWIRARFMDTPFLRAAFQIVVGGLIVFAAGILIGSA